MADELKAFNREERFIVIKRKHLHSYTESDLRSWLRSNDIPTSECVVVESDWPEYAQVWAMIEARVNGNAQLPSQGGEAVAMPATVEYVGKAQGHGHVTPRADGVKARCGGPTLCQVCKKEQAVLYTHPADQVDGVVVSRGLLERLFTSNSKYQFDPKTYWPAHEELRALLATTERGNKP